MKLLTKEIIAAFEKNPLYSHDGQKPEDVKIIVKFFNPCGAATWYITEATKQEDGDWLMFGWCDLGMGCPELGYVSFNELASIKTKPFGLGIERDMYYGQHTLAEVMKSGR